MTLSHPHGHRLQFSVSLAIYRCPDRTSVSTGLGSGTSYASSVRVAGSRRAIMSGNKKRGRGGQQAAKGTQQDRRYRLSDTENTMRTARHGRGRGDDSTAAGRNLGDSVLACYVSAV